MFAEKTSVVTLIDPMARTVQLEDGGSGMRYAQVMYVEMVYVSTLINHWVLTAVYMTRYVQVTAV